MKLKDFLELTAFVPVEVRQWDADEEEMTTLKEHKSQLIFSEFGEHEVISITAEIKTETKCFDNSIQAIPKLVVVIQ